MWNELTTTEQLNELKSRSATMPVLIYKHSTRCGISSMARGRLERAWEKHDSDKLEPYYLDLVQYRSLSNAIASDFGVMHESPQVLVIVDGECIYNASHMDIDYEELMNAASGVKK